MWEVYEHHALVRKLGKLPVEVLKRYEKWKLYVKVIDITPHDYRKK